MWTGYSLLWTMYVESQGQGVPLVLVHGWGMHGALWDPVVEALTAAHRVVRPDLPGHGWSGETVVVPGAAGLADALAAAVPEPAIWLGWSMGALVCMTLALRHPGHVQGLVLVAGTPRFVQCDGWSHGMPLERLEAFAAELNRDYAACLDRFLALQARPGPDARLDLRELHRLAASRPAPRQEALRAGLDVLRHTDLRHRLGELGCPSLVLTGARDRLVPPAAGEILAAGLPDARHVVLDEAGHAPFLSHTHRFATTVLGFTSERVTTAGER